MAQPQTSISNAPPIPEIIVISLPSETHRRSSVEKQLTSLELPFSFLDAVDGSKGHPLFERFSPQKASKIGEIPLTPAHLGCYASHYLAWQKCVDDEKPKIILEDDALIYPNEFESFIDLIPDLPAQVECVRLFQNKSRKTKSLPIFCTPKIQIRKFMRGHKSATGYYLTPSGAHKLIQHAAVWAEPLDLEMDQFWINKVECYGTVPACLTNDSGFESAIDKGMDTRKLRGGWMRWKWRLYNLISRFPRALHNTIFHSKWLLKKLTERER